MKTAFPNATEKEIWKAFGSHMVTTIFENIHFCTQHFINAISCYFSHVYDANNDINIENFPFFLQTKNRINHHNHCFHDKNRFDKV